MKIVFKQALIGTIVAAAALSASTAWATNKLNFSANILQPSCQISGNNGDVSVDFGDVDFSQAADYGVQKSFTIALTHCPSSTMIDVGLRGNEDTASTTSTKHSALALDTGTGMASGVGISVTDEQNKALFLDDSVVSNPKETDASGAVSFVMKASITEDTQGSAKAGKISASEDIVLHYY
ncbi:TPA: type 1 fimbrial protein [Klebsiella aerogenes]|nr:type 1 fimbrial protein [Klebsiella aerogenes]